MTGQLEGKSLRELNAIIEEANLERSKLIQKEKDAEIINLLVDSLH
ncbi:MAG: hypothetical protein HZA34_00715 [Candidatus Pacebacteria bacterium]|nr:hypothetical protein [Candidatus Paceibacterota bacterium]